jgi:adenosylcobinamide kinase/adenosylcobinamide-phosphate guanylyltransferase
MLVLIGGGVRCGKSAFALALARRLGQQRVYIATAEARDDEMALRIERHIQERGADFRTIEAPINVVEACGSAGDADVVVLDCLTLWLSNLLLRGDAPPAILRQVDRLVETARSTRPHTIVVTNEVGMGIVPETPLGRVFRDLCGRAHQAISARAEEVYFGALGSLIRLKPAPLALVTTEEGSR